MWYWYCANIPPKTIGRNCFIFIFYVRIGPVRFGPVRFGPVRFGPVRFGPVRFGPVWFGPVRFGPVRFGSDRFGSDRFGSVRFSWWRERKKIKKGFDTKGRYGRVDGGKGEDGRIQWKGNGFDVGGRERVKEVT
jgi:hypothetical protein